MSSRLTYNAWAKEIIKKLGIKETLNLIEELENVLKSGIEQLEVKKEDN
jgi:hypothetical protein